MTNKETSKTYLFLNGTDYLSTNGAWERAEVGDVRDDVLTKTARWLIAKELVEELKEDSVEGEAKDDGSDSTHSG